MTLDVNLGQVIQTIAFAGTVIWAHSQMKARVDVFLETLDRHERRLDSHEARLIEHGEELAAFRPRRS